MHFLWICICSAFVLQVFCICSAIVFATVMQLLGICYGYAIVMHLLWICYALVRHVLFHATHSQATAEEPMEEEDESLFPLSGRFAFPHRMITLWQIRTGLTQRKYFSMGFKKPVKRMRCGIPIAMRSLKYVFNNATGHELVTMLTRNNLHLATTSDDGKKQFVTECVQIYAEHHPQVKIPGGAPGGSPGGGAPRRARRARRRLVPALPPTGHIMDST